MADVVIVADSGPLIGLACIGKLDLVKALARRLALALKYPSSLMLVDDKKARRVAKAAHQEIVGTVGLLARAKRAGLVTEVRTSLDALRANGIRLSDDLVEQILKSVGEA